MKLNVVQSNNIKLYSNYIMFGSDLLFYYGVKVLYLSQVKHISDSNIVFLSTIFAITSIISLFISNFINKKMGNKRALILGDIINILSMVFIILGQNFIQIAFSEIFSAIAFSLKNISISPILEESIPNDEPKNDDKKMDLFSKIDGKAYMKYCIFSSISTLSAGFLYEFNPYLPMILCTICTVISLCLALKFKEKINNYDNIPNKPITAINNTNDSQPSQFQNEKNKNKKSQNKNIKNKNIQNDSKPKDNKNNKKILNKNNTQILNELKEGISYTVKSGRVRALMIILGFLWGIFILYMTYQTTLLKELNIKAQYIGIIVMILEIIKGIGGRFANKYNFQIKNKSLSGLGLVTLISFILAGVISLANISINIKIFAIIAIFSIIEVSRGIYTILYKRYLNNFSNSEILPTLYMMLNIYWNVGRVVITMIATLILMRFNIKEGVIISGSVFLILLIIIYFYIKPKLGLNPNEYKKEDLKYSNLQKA